MRRKEPQLERWQPVELTQQPEVPTDTATEASSQVEAPGAPLPGAIDPLPLPGFWPFGSQTEFYYLYLQLGGLQAEVDALELASGAQTNIENNFTEVQSISITAIDDSVPLDLDLNNNSTGMSYVLTLAHRYSGGVGPVGLGSGINLLVESATEGVKGSVASFEGQSTVNTTGAMHGEAGINAVVAGDSERVMTLGYQKVRVELEPAASASYGLFTLGNAAFVGDADGTHLAIKSQAGFQGTLIDAQQAGVSRFTLSPAGRVTLPMVPTASDQGASVQLGSGGFAGGGGHFIGETAGTVLGVNAATGFAGALMELETNGVSRLRLMGNGDLYLNDVLFAPTGGGDAFIGVSNAWSAAQTFTLNDTAGSAIRYPVRVRHTNSGGNGAVGIGAGIQFETEIDNGSTVTAGSIDCKATNVSSANFSSEWHFPMALGGISLDPFIIMGPGCAFPGDALASSAHALLEIGNGGFLGGAGNFSGSSGGTIIGVNIPNVAEDLMNLQVNGDSRLWVLPTGVQVLRVWDTTDSAMATLLQMEHRLNTGTAQIGMGIQMDFAVEDDAGSPVTLGLIGFEASAVAAGAVQGEIVISRRDGGSISEVLRFNDAEEMVVPVRLAHTGDRIGFYGQVPVTKPSVSGSQSGGAALTSLLAALESQGLILNATSA